MRSGRFVKRSMAWTGSLSFKQSSKSQGVLKYSRRERGEKYKDINKKAVRLKGELNGYKNIAEKIVTSFSRISDVGSHVFLL